MEEFERKPHDDGIPMKVDTMAAIIKSVNGLTYRFTLDYKSIASSWDIVSELKIVA